MEQNQNQDIRSIMELVAKGVITPEEGEKMINELDKQDSFTYQAKEQARSFGEKVGDGIDKIVPKTKAVFKKGFDATAEFSQKMSDKLDENTQNVKDKTAEFNQKVSGKVDEATNEVKEATNEVKETTAEFNQKVSTKVDEATNEVKQATNEVKETTTEFNQKVSTKVDEATNEVKETTTEFNQKVSTKVDEATNEVKEATSEFNQKVSSKFEEEKNDVKEATAEFNQKVSTKFEEGKNAVDEAVDKVFKKEEEEQIDFSYLNDIEPIFKDAGDEVPQDESSSEDIIDLITDGEEAIQETIEELIDKDKDEVK